MMWYLCILHGIPACLTAGLQSSQVLCEFQHDSLHHCLHRVNPSKDTGGLVFCLSFTCLLVCFMKLLVITHEVAVRKRCYVITANLSCLLNDILNCFVKQYI